MRLNESDTNIRTLERKWKETKSPQDQERYFAALERSIGRYNIVVHTHTHYGRGTPLPLNQALNSANDAWSILKAYGLPPYRFGQDEDAFFIGRAKPQMVLEIQEVIREAEDELDGTPRWKYFFVGSDGDGSFYLHSPGVNTIRLEPVSESSWEEVSHPVETNINPAAVWWDEYGQYGGYFEDASGLSLAQNWGIELESRLTSSQLWLLVEAGLNRRDFLKLMGKVAGAAVSAPLEGPAKLAASAVGKLAGVGAARVLPKLDSHIVDLMAERIFQNKIGSHFEHHREYPTRRFPNLVTILKTTQGDSDSVEMTKLIKKFLPKVSKPEQLKAIEDTNALIRQERDDYLKGYNKQHNRCSKNDAEWIFPQIVDAYELTPGFVSQILNQLDAESIIKRFFVWRDAIEIRNWLGGDLFDKLTQKSLKEVGVERFINKIINGEFYDSDLPHFLENAIKLVPQVKQRMASMGIHSASDLKEVISNDLSGFVKKLHQHGIIDDSELNRVELDITYEKEQKEKWERLEQKRRVEREREEQEKLRAKEAGREFGYEKMGMLDAGSSRPASARGPFESRLKSNLRSI